jgi:hypothetical protein
MAVHTQGRDRPFVFVIMPFAREWADFYELGVKPACEAAGTTCARVDKQIFLENMLHRIYAEIERADLIVAEMTDQNPNVFYETGYAHGLAKPVILLTKTADGIPFDLRHYPHIVHDGQIRTLKDELERVVRWCIENPEELRAANWRRGATEQEDLERMAQHIENYLRAHNYSMMSFDRVRRNVNPDYADEKLLRLIDVSPSRFRRVRISGGEPGIGLVARQ